MGNAGIIFFPETNLLIAYEYNEALSPMSRLKYASPTSFFLPTLIVARLQGRSSHGGNQSFPISTLPFPKRASRICDSFRETFGAAEESFFLDPLKCRQTWNAEGLFSGKLEKDHTLC